jgi:amino acid permease
MLFVFLLLIGTAFMVLLRDIWCSIVVFFLMSVTPGFGSDTSVHDVLSAYSMNANTVLFFVILSVYPFMLCKDLQGLRYNCFVGFVSVIVLMCSLCYRSFEKNVLDSDDGFIHEFHEHALLMTDEPLDALLAFPLVALAFLSQFNVLSVHGALTNPTRDRLKIVIHSGVAICSFIFLFFGLGGYMYAWEATRDNILLNFNPNDKVILFGRVGLGLTLLCNMPMVVLPCRDAFLLIPTQYREYRAEAEKLSYGATASQSEMKSILPHKMKPRSQSEEERAEDEEFEVSRLTFHIATFFIASTCYIAAVYIPGVSTVWNLCGSSFCFIIAYILPSACYIKIRGNKGINNRLVGAYALLIFASISMVACTAQAVYRMFWLSI